MDALGAGATLLVANKRLARAWSRASQQHFHDLGRTVWQSADVQIWESWIDRCWENLIVHDDSLPALLSSAQEQILWEQVIRRSPEGETLLQIRATAAAAADAWRLIHHWRLPLDEHHYTGADDPQAFRQWAEDFMTVCEEQHWLESARVLDVVRNGFGGGQLDAPRQLLLAGFDELTPQQQMLLDMLEEQGCRLERVDEFTSTARPMRLGLRDQRTEFRTVATWARQALEEESGLRIGIVVPDLMRHRTLVEHTFMEVLHPGSLLPGAPRRSRAFHLSAAPALSESPLVAAAWPWLGLGAGSISLAEAGLLLRSPFCRGAVDERGSRALLDAELRSRGYLHIRPELLRSLASHREKGEPAAFACPQLLRSLQRWPEWPDEQPPSGWSYTFSELLHAAGWPGERPLDSAEYQAVEAWKGLLSDFATLDSVLPALSYRNALTRLRALADEQLFQPENTGAPIQIMGALEAAGTQFDILWIAGLHDGAWPVNRTPHPFLPLHLQRDNALPHSSAARELTRARQVTDRLFASAAEIICSYPEVERDQELRPSPLIASLQKLELAELALPHYPVFTDIYAQHRPVLEVFTDHRAPALPCGVAQAGGTAVLTAQAACPFQAFARFRLGARGLGEAAPGLDSSDRGNLVHYALESLWNEIGSHAELCARTPEGRQTLVREAVERAIARHARDQFAAPMKRLRELEQQRLERLLTEWLEIEEQRAPFTVVRAELRRPVEIGGLKLDIRIDRVDELEDGRHVIIDYKTGEPSLGAWSSTRPDDPQLPVYCATHSQDIAALAFAQVKAGKVKVKGFSAEGDTLPGVKAFHETKEPGTLAERIREWNAVLQQLATEFREGHAVVNPKKGARTCEHCELITLCRVQKGTRPLLEEEEETDSNAG